MSQTRSQGRGVYIMTGLNQNKISTEAVDRILNKDSLATVYSFGLTLDGHSIYLLTLKTSNITLAYDLTSGKWGQWTSLTLSTGQANTLSRVGTLATSIAALSYLADGDPQIISSTEQIYSRIFQCFYVAGSSTFSFTVLGSPSTPVSCTVYGYTESYFKFIKHINFDGNNLLLHETDGHLYSIQSTLYQDAGIPINVFIRSRRLDGGNLEPKTMGEFKIVGDKTLDTMMVRWSSDDCHTFSAYREVNLNYPVPMLRQCGSFERRTVETRYVGNYPLCLEALELDIGQ